MNAPTVICNTGLGDFFVFSGAFVELARLYGSIRIPALPQYIQTIRACLVRHPEIEVFPIIDDDHMLEDYLHDPNTIRCHWRKIYEAQAQYEPIEPDISWDRWAYRQFKVDFEHRWSSCPLQAAADCTPQIVFPGPYYLLHEDPERGFPITYPPWHPVITTRRAGRYGGRTLLAWCDAIVQAKELHFIDSSMWHLANSLNLDPRQPRYLHRYVRQWHPTWHSIETRKMWQYIDGTPTRILESETDLTRVKI
jgi:hypothetical protein